MAPNPPALGTSTVKLLEAYIQQISVVPYLTSLFQAPPSNYFNSEMVQLDIFRDSEEIAIAVHDLSAGSRENELGGWIDKGYTPPIYKESATLQAYTMAKRLPGQSPFDEPDFATNATLQAFRVMRALENKIRRALEVQAAQVLTTGAFTAKDYGGRDIYTISYGARSSHFPTSGVAWSGNAGDKLGDLESLCDVITTDGQKIAVKAIFGQQAWRDFIADPVILKLFENRPRLDIGTINPQALQNYGGAVRKGVISVGAYELEMFVYTGAYIDPITKTRTPYIGPNKVLIVGQDARLDLVFGAIPKIAEPARPALEFLPSRFSDGDARFDLSVKAYITEDGEALKMQCGTRPLCIPTAIDTFGCLSTR